MPRKLVVGFLWISDPRTVCGRDRRRPTYDLMFLTAWGRLSMLARSWQGGLNQSQLHFLESLFLREPLETGFVYLLWGELLGAMGLYYTHTHIYIYMIYIYIYDSACKLLCAMCDHVCLQTNVKHTSLNMHYCIMHCTAVHHCTTIITVICRSNCERKSQLPWAKLCRCLQPMCWERCSLAQWPCHLMHQ